MSRSPQKIFSGILKKPLVRRVARRTIPPGGTPVFRARDWSGNPFLRCEASAKKIAAESPVPFPRVSGGKACAQNLIGDLGKSVGFADFVKYII
jgi:hypothetical protein